MRLGPLVIVIVVCPSFLGCPLCPCALFALLPWSFSPFLGSSFAFLLLLLLLLPLCGDLTESAVEEKMNFSSLRSVAKSNSRTMAVLKSGVAKVLDAEEEHHGTAPKEILRPWFGAWHVQQYITVQINVYGIIESNWHKTCNNMTTLWRLLKLGRLRSTCAVPRSPPRPYRRNQKARRRNRSSMNKTMRQWQRAKR